MRKSLVAAVVTMTVTVGFTTAGASTSRLPCGKHRDGSLTLCGQATAVVHFASRIGSGTLRFTRGKCEIIREPGVDSRPRLSALYGTHHPVEDYPGGQGPTLGPPPPPPPPKKWQLENNLHFESSLLHLRRGASKPRIELWTYENVRIVIEKNYARFSASGVTAEKFQSGRRAKASVHGVVRRCLSRTKK